MEKQLNPYRAMESYKEKTPEDVYLIDAEKIKLIREITRENRPHVMVIECRHPDTAYGHQRGNIPYEEIDITPKGEKQSEITAGNIEAILDPTKDKIMILDTRMSRTGDMGRIIEARLEKAGFEIIDPKNEYRGENSQGRNNVDIYELGEDGTKTSLHLKDSRYAKAFTESENELIAVATSLGMDPLQYLIRGNIIPAIENIKDINRRASAQFSLYLRAAEEYSKKLENVNDKRLVIIQIGHIESLDKLWELSSGGKYTQKFVTGPIKGEMALFTLPLEDDKESIEVHAVFPYRKETRNEMEKGIVYNKKRQTFDTQIMTSDLSKAEIEELGKKKQ